ncbi:MAG: SDR family NAD(P)-dependent oxidoreductase, partial [Actinomycetota bacterium]
MGSLEGRRAVVTGGGRGIGRAIARRLAAEGAGVVVAARTQSELDEVVAEIQSAGGVAAAVRCDVSSDDSVTA